MRSLGAAHSLVGADAADVSVFEGSEDAGAEKTYFYIYTAERLVVFAAPKKIKVGNSQVRVLLETKLKGETGGHSKIAQHVAYRVPCLRTRRVSNQRRDVLSRCFLA